MQFKLTLRKAAELGIGLIGITILILAGCGGGGSSVTVVAGNSYTASAGVGEVLQFSVNTTDMTYSYSVTKTSYAASGVIVGRNGTGSLNSNGNGAYSVGVSSDNFIQGGTVFPIRYGLLVGHLLINTIGGTNRIPVFGISKPITTLAGLAGTYNFEGFGCSTLGIANVAGNPACGSNYGTMTIDAASNVTKCNHGDITTSPTTNACATTQTRAIQVLSVSPGVFDFRDATNHLGWFFAFTAPNGQNVAVIDHDDAIANVYGHTVLSTYASTVSGSVNGNYFDKDNEGGEQLVAISGATYSNNLGFTGAIIYNVPWSGLSTFQVASGVNTITGIAMTTGTGAYTHTITSDPAYFAVGLKY